MTTWKLDAETRATINGWAILAIAVLMVLGFLYLTDPGAIPAIGIAVQAKAIINEPPAQAKPEDVQPAGDVTKIRQCVAHVVGLPGGAYALASERGKLWKPGTILHVRFIDGGPKCRKMVEDGAREWEKHANIHFEFDDSPNAPIRVRFNSGGGSWSYIGTDCLLVDMARETMNFGWLDEDSEPEEYYVAIHEFGHALGMIHEHQSPKARIPWNIPAVNAWAWKTQRWTPAEAYYNIIMRESVMKIDAGPFDKLSIMEYPVDPALTRNGFSVDWNKHLSAGDIERIARYYPRTDKQMAPEKSNCIKRRVKNRGGIGGVPGA